MVTIKTLIKKILLTLTSYVARNTILRRARGGEGLILNGFPRCEIKGKLSIGQNIKINSGNRSNPIGSGYTTNIIVKKKASLSIGDNVGISNSTIFASHHIIIEADVKIGGGCRIWDTDHHSFIFHERNAVPEIKPVGETIVIGRGAWLAADVTVLKGVRIGCGAVIACGSVVTRDVPDFQVWGGVPAKFIKDLAS